VLTDSARDFPPEPDLEPTETHLNAQGGSLRIGNPGNRGNPNGRTPRIPVKERAGRALRLLLADLEDQLERERKGEGRKLSTRDKVAYARLCAEVEARDLPGDKPPVRVMVLSGSEEDLRRAVTEPTIEAHELDAGADERALPPGDARAAPRAIVLGLIIQDATFQMGTPTKELGAGQGGVCLRSCSTGSLTSVSRAGSRSSTIRKAG
jgi:hypothetical protein